MPATAASSFPENRFESVQQNQSVTGASIIEPGMLELTDDLESLELLRERAGMFNPIYQISSLMAELPDVEFVELSRQRANLLNPLYQVACLLVELDA